MFVGQRPRLRACRGSASGPGPSSSEAPQTDQTVPVSRGTRLAIDNFAGEVVIHTWDKDSLRVQARHPSRTRA